LTIPDENIVIFCGEALQSLTALSRETRKSSKCKESLYLFPEKKFFIAYFPHHPQNGSSSAYFHTVIIRNMAVQVLNSTVNLLQWRISGAQF
jgi:hypothetical protein